MNILLTTYPEAYLNKAAGEYELEQLSTSLTELGVDNSIYSHLSHNIHKFTHVIHFSSHESGSPLLHSIRKQHKCKIFLWPLYWPSKGKPKPSFDFLTLFDGYILKSKSEEQFLFDGIEPLAPIIQLPLYIDSAFIDPTPISQGIFKSVYNLSQFNLWVGQLSPEKSQLEFIRLIRNVNQKFVFIGDVSDYSYLIQCKSEGSNNCIFVNQLPASSELLISAYQDCSRYIELSAEPAGTSALEAAQFSCQMLLSDNRWSRELLSNRAHIINPSDEKGINKFLNDELGSLKYKDRPHLFETNDAINFLLKSL